MREDPAQRNRSRYVQILRLPWLSEMTLRLGNYAGLARAFKSSARPEAFAPETLEVYRGAWSRPGAMTGMLNWYRALFVEEPATLPPRSLIPPTLVLWGDKDEFAVPHLADDSAALCANAGVRHFPEGTHWIIHDAPDVVRDALLDHLQRQ
jgi:pimeloyl-ACP methyl ester carboxylesterase